MSRLRAAIVTVLIGSGPVLGQADGTGSARDGGESFRIDRWTAREGLPQASVNAIAETGDGRFERFGESVTAT